MIDITKEILISEKEFTDINYERLKMCWCIWKQFDKC